jgi:phosphoribosylformylglycinamidine cyclo-ligase
MARRKTSGGKRRGGQDAALTYQAAGVDVEAGERMVESIGEMVRRTYSPRVMGNLGGFAGLFSLDFRESLLRRDYRDPVLIGCCDGVGSKLKVAFEAGKVDAVGIDLVAMNANDLACTGGEPLFFLDYLGVGRLEPERMRDIVAGVAEGCRQAGMALLGGETAELPDFYRPREFEMAGFAVGVVERRRILGPDRVQPGDVAIALASSGLHSNGYALARRVIFERAGLKLTDRPAELEGATVAEAMLEPTRIYAQSVYGVVSSYRVRRVVRSIAHITGGGLPGNLPRALPEGLTVRLRRSSWETPGIFRLIAEAGPVDDVEMKRVFNMGVGMVMIVAAGHERAVMTRLRRCGERCWPLGKVVKGGPALQWA